MWSKDVTGEWIFMCVCVRVCERKSVWIPNCGTVCLSVRVSLFMWNEEHRVLLSVICIVCCIEFACVLFLYRYNYSYQPMFASIYIVYAIFERWFMIILFSRTQRCIDMLQSDRSSLNIVFGFWTATNFRPHSIYSICYIFMLFTKCYPLSICLSQSKISLWSRRWICFGICLLYLYICIWFMFYEVSLVQ